MRGVAAFCVMMFLLAGCESGNDKRAKTPEPPPPPRPATLDGTYWKLVELDGAPVVAPDTNGGGEPHILLDPHDKRAVGSGGVNRFAGTYQSSGNGSLRFSPLAATKMAGPAPMMEQEQKFFEALSATTGFALSGRSLELRAGSRVLAKFDAGAP